MKNYNVYGIGNALVDTEYEVDDGFLTVADFPKGLMTLIDQDQRHKLIHLLEEEHEHQVIKQAGGGSAANTMVAIAQLGGSVFYSCKVADDATGDFFMHDLAEAGVETNLDKGREAGVTGKCVSMITPDAERTLTTHLGISESLSSDELDHSALQRSDCLYIEGYLVTSETALSAALRAQQLVRQANNRVSLTLSDPSMVDNFSDQFRLFFDAGVDLLLCNEDEATLWTSANSREQAMTALQEFSTQVVMTCGKEGAYVYDGNTAVLVPGVTSRAVDTTGAGDMFAGAFLYGLSVGMGFIDAAQLANRAASLLVSSFGARIPRPAAQALLG